MRRLIMFLLTTPYMSIVSLPLTATPVQAQGYYVAHGRIPVAPRMHMCFGTDCPPNRDVQFVYPESYGPRGYGQPYGYSDQYNPRYNNYDSYNDRYYSGSQLPHGPIVTGGIAGALIGGALGKTRGALLGGGVGMLGGAYIQNRNNRRDAREYARQINYAPREREYEPRLREEVAVVVPTVLVTNATPWPLLAINRTNNTNATLAAGQSVQMVDGDIVGIMDVKGKTHPACVAKTLTGWTFTAPALN